MNKKRLWIIFCMCIVIIGFVASSSTISNDDFVGYMMHNGYSCIDNKQTTIFVVPFTAYTRNDVHISGSMIKFFGQIYILNKKTI